MKINNETSLNIVIHNFFVRSSYDLLALFLSLHSSICGCRLILQAHHPIRLRKYAHTAIDVLFIFIFPSRKRCDAVIGHSLSAEHKNLCLRVTTSMVRVSGRMQSVLWFFICISRFFSHIFREFQIIFLRFVLFSFSLCVSFFCLGFDFSRSCRCALSHFVCHLIVSELKVYRKEKESFTFVEMYAFQLL